MIVQWKSKLPVTQPKTTIPNFKVSNTNYPTIPNPSYPTKWQKQWKKHKQCLKKMKTKKELVPIVIPSYPTKNNEEIQKQSLKIMKKYQVTQFKTMKTYKNNVFKQWKQKNWSTYLFYGEIGLLLLIFSSTHLKNLQALSKKKLQALSNTPLLSACLTVQMKCQKIEIFIIKPRCPDPPR